MNALADLLCLDVVITAIGVIRRILSFSGI